MAPARERAHRSRRLALVAADAAGLERQTCTLIPMLQAAGHHVLAFVPEMEAGASARRTFDAPGLRIIPFPFLPGGVRPFGDRRSLASLESGFREHAVDVVVGYGLKPIWLASLAAQSVGVPRIVSVLSSLAPLDADGQRTPGLVLHALLRRALGGSHAVVFYNRDHAARFAAAKLLPPQIQPHVVPGMGVDLTAFPAVPLPDLGRGLVFTMVAPFDRTKGVIEFCEAARRIRARRSAGARFVLAGSPGKGRARISEVIIMRYADCVDVVCPAEDLRALLAECHVYVQPSHGEAMPGLVLKALATGRPVLTTDTPGCRETVDEQVNGVLVAPRDPVALASGIERILKRPDLIPWMSRASRRKAEQRFDATAVGSTMMGILGL